MTVTNAHTIGYSKPFIKFQYQKILFHWMFSNEKYRNIFIRIVWKIIFQYANECTWIRRMKSRAGRCHSWRLDGIANSMNASIEKKIVFDSFHQINFAFFFLLLLACACWLVSIVTSILMTVGNIIRLYAVHISNAFARLPNAIVWLRLYNDYVQRAADWFAQNEF